MITPQKYYWFPNYGKKASQHSHAPLLISYMQRHKSFFQGIPMQAIIILMSILKNNL